MDILPDTLICECWRVLGIGMLYVQSRQGSERSRQPNFMIGDRHLTIDERLIQIQDEIRSEFGWSLDKDLYVAKWLVNELVSSASRVVLR